MAAGKLTVASVGQRVAAIGRAADLDDDYAREKERDLWGDVLIAAAEGKDVTRLAQAALATRGHIYARHGR